MEWIQNMNAAVNYIEEHILEEPDLGKLGKLPGVPLIIFKGFSPISVVSH